PLRRDDMRLGQSDRSVQRDPARHLRLREMDRIAAHLPNPGVRFRPYPTYQIGDPSESLTHVSVDPVAGSRVEDRGLQELAIGVELQLVHREIPDTNRGGAAIAAQWQFTLDGSIAAVETVKHLQARMGQLGGMHQPPEIRLCLPRAPELEKCAKREC